jgi:hypothetical protein
LEETFGENPLKLDFVMIFGLNTKNTSREIGETTSSKFLHNKANNTMKR